MTATERPLVGPFAATLRRASDGDDAALEELNGRLFVRLTRFAAARGAVDPEAIANQALFDGIQSIDRLNRLDEPTFRSYVYTCAANRVKNEQRARQVATVDLRPDVHDVSPADDPAVIVVGDGWFDDAVEHLPPDQRAVILERFQRGSSVGETAERLGKSRHAVRHLQDRALLRIRRYVLAAGLAALLLVATLVLVLRGDESVRIEPVDPPTIERSLDDGGDSLTVVGELEDGPTPTGQRSIEVADEPGSVVAYSGEVDEATPTTGSDETSVPPSSVAQAATPQAGTATPQAGTVTGQTAAPIDPITVADAGGVVDCSTSSVVLEPARIWPPNKAMVDVVADFSFGPNCAGTDPTVVLTAVEVIDATAGSPNNTADPVAEDVVATIGGPGSTLQLRATKTGATRLYVMTWTVTDANGVDTTVQGTVTVGPPN